MTARTQLSTHTHTCVGSQVCKRLSSRCCGRCEHRTGWFKGRSEQSPRTSGPRGLREIPEDFWSQGLRAIPGLQDPRGSEQSPRTSGPQALRAIPGLQDPGAQSNPPGLQDPRRSEQSQDFRTLGLRAIPQDFRTPGAQSNPRTSGPQGAGKVMIYQVSTKCYQLYP